MIEFIKCGILQKSTKTLPLSHLTGKAAYKSYISAVNDIELSAVKKQVRIGLNIASDILSVLPLLFVKRQWHIMGVKGHY